MQAGALRRCFEMLARMPCINQLPEVLATSSCSTGPDAQVNKMALRQWAVWRRPAWH